MRYSREMSVWLCVLVICEQGAVHAIGKFKTPMTIRATLASDSAALQTVLDKTQLFPPEMLPEMLNSHLSNAQSTDIWLTWESEGAAKGFCYAVPEKLAEGTWNMLAIAVHPESQAMGVGSALVAKLEAMLRELRQRILIADTSGTKEYRRTRAFYQKNGYCQEAVIRDFWAPGANKVTFWKSLK
jgi:ribosomal protein S18 acetylase RimI-like enzyme